MQRMKGMMAVSVFDAVGAVLCHDITRIVPGQGKGPAFRKGHVISSGDISELLAVGKEHIYVFDLKQGFVHEDEAAMRLARAGVGAGLSLAAPCEGKVNVTADRQGLLKVNVERLMRLNSLGEVAFVTAHGNQTVAAGDLVAGTRVVPLVIEEEKLRVAEALLRDGPILELAAFRRLRVGMVTTGSEIYHGRIKDAFGPVLREKFAALGSEIFRQIFVSDDVPMTVAAIHELMTQGAQMIVVTGGMSVDPDDLSPASIRAAGGEVVSYGAPVLPGAMFMLARLGRIPVLGLPGCVMYHKASIFDLIVPRLLAGDDIAASDIAALGHGGLCLGCPTCRFPHCAFGKGC